MGVLVFIGRNTQVHQESFSKSNSNFTWRQNSRTKIDMKNSGLIATRRSLVERLADWGDQRRWQEFFDTYWKLIHSAARKSGLTDAEAQEVVQETSSPSRRTSTS